MQKTAAATDAEPSEGAKVKAGIMTLEEAYSLFHRLGVDARGISHKEFRAAYVHLARCYHPDQDPKYHELMANINAARTTILYSQRR